MRVTLADIVDDNHKSGDSRRTLMSCAGCCGVLSKLGR